MNKQFTANDVRRLSNRIPRNNDEIADAQEALRAYADRLEADEKAVPIGWVFQNEETGYMTFCENDGINNAENFAINNPRYVLCGPAYTQPPAASVPDAMVNRLAHGDVCSVCHETR